MNTSEWLTAELKKAGWSAYRLSQETYSRSPDGSGVPQPTISRILSGETKSPGLSVLTKITGALNIPSLAMSTFEKVKNYSASLAFEKGGVAEDRIAFLSQLDDLTSNFPRMAAQTNNPVSMKIDRHRLEKVLKQISEADPEWANKDLKLAASAICSYYEDFEDNNEKQNRLHSTDKAV